MSTEKKNTAMMDAITKYSSAKEEFISRKELVNYLKRKAGKEKKQITDAFMHANQNSYHDMHYSNYFTQTYKSK